MTEEDKELWHFDETKFDLKLKLRDAPSAQIVFAERDGELHFAYSLERESYMRDRFGQVPDKVVQRGKRGIHAYVTKLMETEREEFYAMVEQHLHFKANPNVLIRVEHGGVKIRGRIIQADARYYTLRMEKPFVAEMKGGGYCWASAMNGHFMFDQKSVDLRLSKDAIESAKHDLVSLYEERVYAKKNAKTIGLVNRLNGKA